MVRKTRTKTLLLFIWGHLTDEQFEQVQRSVIAFMNARWPNTANIGIDS